MKELRYRAQVFKNPADLVSAAARQWFEAVKVLKDNQAFNVALSGGRIAVPFLQEASALFGKSPALLKRLNIFWADERCVGPEHPESNYAMFRENFANPVSFPDSRVFRFRGEDHPDKAAKSMASTLKVKLPLNSRGVPAFDLIFLGMGEDGHVASLFPENMSDDLMRSDDHVFEVVASKPPPQRLTLSYNVLETSKHVCALICGPGKETALRESIGNHGKTPFAHVIQSRVHTEILTDISINDHV
ncbi:MAG: 6-phosphogluconolactonase [Verrucomicrobia bacterium]|jgi:6-phosphogluconolactonase|nr:6-phosphogluconolactonase [Verrucomicrobiota bacterium]MBT4274568.1 6-phosphogluconolactonase [Verrucomicrobiota bacterium]MBT5061050.1 6-phosphogluconolactonase [Verrucomicrobiota bacterium]MBT5478585.1 6-phosphogluconolactonase [Verrucomicrobiota bacterium]MBT6239241.1 6-phosphogluconolactonase [Verrucomicrobiota bacterium]